jgi:glycosyltransferase involved in cell wall biosynthesis
MRLCFLADLNSIHSRRFIRYFCRTGHEVRVLSSTWWRGGSFEGVQVVNLRRPRASYLGPTRRMRRWLERRLREKVAWSPELRVRLARREIAREQADDLESRLAFLQDAAAAAREAVRDFRPDLLQCLRLPVEGYLGACAEHPATFQFCWGNDLTLYAATDPTCAEWTRTALGSCRAFLADCARDIRLAREHGLAASVPALVTPGGGGIDTREPPPSFPEAGPGSRLILLTLRGPGGRYTDNLPVLRALPLLRERIGREVVLRVTGGAGPHADLLRGEAARLHEGAALEFLGTLPHEQVPEAIRSADLVFSIARHDGTPNSMLETMWSGGIPVHGDLESIREWIEDGRNGYLFSDMEDPELIAGTFARAAGDRERHAGIRAINRALIRERADYETCMRRVEAFYRDCLA